MSLAEALGRPLGRYDHVAAAYDGMNKEDREVFRGIIADHGWPPAQIAKALRTLGYDVDRKQVQHFREKLALGKVKL